MADAFVLKSTSNPGLSCRRAVRSAGAVLTLCGLLADGQWKGFRRVVRAAVASEPACMPAIAWLGRRWIGQGG
jgi:hypothetical protein